MADTTNSVWSTSVPNGPLDHLGGMMAQAGMYGVQGQDSNSASQSILFNADSLGAGSPPDASSVLRLQQNLQRLYGSLGHVHGSRSSLPDIQEEGPSSSGVGQLSSQQQQPPISTPALQAPVPGRSTSEDDLFRMDHGAQANGIAPNNPLADLSLVGQMPSDGAESRTLFIRGIDPASSDADLKELFDCFGDVRAIYTACKHRGMVVISYHDIRAATLAHHTLHGQDVKGRILTCQFTRPKDSSEAASGTLLVVLLDTTLSRQDLFYILSKYGELRDLKEDPLRPNYCIVEYFDARHAAAALTGVAQSPETSDRVLVFDAGSVSASNLGALTGQPQLRNASSSPALGSLGPQLTGSSSSSQLDATYMMGNGNGSFLHQPDLAGMTRSLSEMSLDGGRLFAPVNGRLSGASYSTGDLSNMGAAGARLNPAALNGLRGASSTGSLWNQAAGVSMGSSPLGGNSGVWPASGVGSLAALQQEHQVAYLQQQNALVQTAAMQAALQQALMVQQAQQAALARTNPSVMGSGMPRRGFSEPSLGGRLARRPADPLAEAERKAQQERLYSLDIAKIMAGEDRRTTLMVKNIPNKYTQKMLLALIEEQFKGTFDFFYLPIDFKNRCNVGYAFINMITPVHIPPLVKEFHGKRWPKFNSEKICHIAYARIQGKSALVQHFQNSSLLHEDKRCRPVVFNKNGQGGEPEAFPLGPAPALAGEQQ